MPSKKVFFKCKPAFVHGAITTEAALEQLAFSKRSIGSCFAGQNTTKKLTGLKEEELRLLLPQIVMVRAEDIDFRAAVDRFYTEINTYIPYGNAGLELEIGLTMYNDKPVTYVEKGVDSDGKEILKYNMPIDVESYVRYRHGLAHPWTAPSPEAAKGNPLIKFYLEDPESVQDNALKTAEIADQAMLTYNQIKDDPKKINMIVTLLKHELRKKPGEISIIVTSMNAEQKLLRARELASLKPDKFLSVATDESLKYKFLLAELIRTQLLRRAGTSIIIAESGDPIGANEEEAIDNLFKNPANTHLLGLLKGQYEQRA